PDQLEIIPRLREHLAPGGALAFQVPNNFGEPSHVLLRELAADPRFADHIGHIEGARGVDPHTYLRLLAADDWRLDIWETTYLHVLQGDDPVFEWISGTGARPFLQGLPDELRMQFEADYRAALRAAYPKRAYGTVLPFQRVFVVATRRP
ncbi:MAG: trans-aconitate methyltransferase, partial [Actinomycetia bacterium]|nr:trans-aconitate methyltransferase [Actinomycetes bacterium]